MDSFKFWLGDFVNYLLVNSESLPDICFGVFGIIGVVSLFVTVSAYIFSDGVKAKLICQYALYISTTLIITSLLYYVLTAVYGYERWICSFAGLFIMFIISSFFRGMYYAYENYEE